MSRHNRVSSVPLEYHSLRFAKMLFKRFPQWKPYSGHYVKQEDGFPTYYLDVAISPVNPNVTDALRITAYPREIIVQWLGGIHSHFDALFGGSTLDYMEASLEFIERIVADKIVFGSYIQDGKPTGAGFWHDLKTAPSPTWLNIKQGSIIMRSWHGVYDAELFANI